MFLMLFTVFLVFHICYIFLHLQLFGRYILLLLVVAFKTSYSILKLISINFSSLSIIIDLSMED